MARKLKILDGELIDRIAAVFRDVGYDGATMTQLAGATGLQRASLYYRFPGGKEEMASEVLDQTAAWVEANLLDPLRGTEAPAVRAKRFLTAVQRFYDDGEKACLQNVLASAALDTNAFDERIASALNMWLVALVHLLRDAGCDAREARARAQHVMALIHGGLVMSRGMGSQKPFQQSLREIQKLLPT